MLFKRCCLLLMASIFVFSLSSCEERGSSISSKNSSEGSSSSEKPIIPPVVNKYDYRFKFPTVLPRIDIKTEDGKNNFATDFDQNDKLNGNIEYVKCNLDVSNCMEDYVLENIPGSVKIRGNATMNYPKKPLRLKFDSKQSLLGLNNDAKCKSWVLLADYKDASMLKNALSFYLGNQLLGSDDLYCSDFQHVKVYLNDQYWGIYLLAEQQQVNKNRVDVFEPEDGYTGNDIGYLFEYDGYYYQEKDDPTFTVAYTNKSILYKKDGTETTAAINGYTLKSDIDADSQKAFIAEYVRLAYKIAYRAVHFNDYYEFNETFTDMVPSTKTNAEEIVDKVLNIDSFVDTYIMQEIICDSDIAWSSFYLSADLSEKGDKKITLEAPWDFDNGYGGKRDHTFTEGDFAGNSQNPWLVLLVNQPWFIERVKAKWQDAHQHGVFSSSLNNIKTFQRIYKVEFEKNFARWPGQISNTHNELVDIFATFKTQEEVSNYMYNWLYKRYNYLNKTYGDGTDILSLEENKPSEN